MKYFLLHRKETNQYGLVEKLSLIFDLTVDDIVHIFNCWSKFDDDSQASQDPLSLIFTNLQELPSSREF